MLEALHLQLLLATFAAWSNRQQARVITYLIEENRVLKEQLEAGGRGLRFWDDQRCRLAAKGKPLGRKLLLHLTTAYQAPNMNAYAERFVRSIRSECLNQIILLGEKSRMVMMK